MNVFKRGGGVHCITFLQCIFSYYIVDPHIRPRRSVYCAVHITASDIFLYKWFLVFRPERGALPNTQPRSTLLRLSFDERTLFSTGFPFCFFIDAQIRGRTGRLPLPKLFGTHSGWFYTAYLLPVYCLHNRFVAVLEPLGSVIK